MVEGDQEVDSYRNNICILPMRFSEFIDWYGELGKLRIFWAKPMDRLELIEKGDGYCLIEVWWLIRGKVKRAFICIVEDPSDAFRILAGDRYVDAVRIVMSPEDSALSHGTVDAKSILYFWDVSSETLDPNNEVNIVKLSRWDDSYIEVFRDIHKSSWGFFIPPRRGDHMVILAYLKDRPVRMAYLNRNNFNIDYGIHVIRSLWRNRIGTRILGEILCEARKLNSNYVSVVRVLRSHNNSSSDKRAISFYRANKPFLRLNLYRISHKSY